MQAAVARGAHRLTHARPWILDDPYALSLVGREWPDVLGRMEAGFSERLLGRAIAGVALRSRIAEDRVLSTRPSQYVVLGAGLDSFAWRYPDTTGWLRIFEVDHPATQSWKRARVRDLALPTGAAPTFVAVDFESTSLRDGLDAAGFDWGRPTVFSWLGVTPYLPLDAIEETLCTIALCRSPSEIVFTYALPSEMLNEDDRETLAILQPMTASSNELIQAFFSPADAESMVGRCDLTVARHPDPAELEQQYFSGRTDGLTPWGIARIMVARVAT